MKVLGMCYILCMTKPSLFIALGTMSGVTGCLQGVAVFASILVFFRKMVFGDGFLIPIKELEFLTNLGQWIRGFGCYEILYLLYCKK
jgi:hypothetical protein